MRGGGGWSHEGDFTETEKTAAASTGPRFVGGGGRDGVGPSILWGHSITRLGGKEAMYCLCCVLEDRQDVCK